MGPCITAATTTSSRLHGMTVRSRAGFRVPLIGSRSCDAIDNQNVHITVCPPQHKA
jgi:hypothetical protein